MVQACFGVLFLGVGVHGTICLFVFLVCLGWLLGVFVLVVGSCIEQSRCTSVSLFPDTGKFFRLSMSLKAWLVRLRNEAASRIPPLGLSVAQLGAGASKVRETRETRVESRNLSSLALGCGRGPTSVEMSPLSRKRTESMQLTTAQLTLTPWPDHILAAKITLKLLKHALFAHNSIPFPFEQIQNLLVQAGNNTKVNPKKRAILRKANLLRRKMNQLESQVDQAMRALFACNSRESTPTSPHPIVIALTVGSSMSRPKVVYLVRFWPSEDQLPETILDDRTIANAERKFVRQLIMCETGLPMPSNTRLFRPRLFLQSPSHVELPHYFHPKHSLTIRLQQACTTLIDVCPPQGVITGADPSTWVRAPLVKKTIRPSVRASAFSVAGEGRQDDYTTADDCSLPPKEVWYEAAASIRGFDIPRCCL